jgi:hypothetical protein
VAAFWGIGVNLSHAEISKAIRWAEQEKEQKEHVGPGFSPDKVKLLTDPCPG